MKKYLFILFLFVAAQLQAQTIISGQVIDEKTKETLPGISIYINSSTIGTTTDSEGRFVLNVPFTGKMELVASHIVYQKKIILVEPDHTKNLLIALIPQDNLLNEVIIRASKNKEDNFNKWGDLFTQVLYGNDPHFVSGCTLKNPDVLVFNFNKETRLLTVYAKSALVIENNLTYYRTKLDLDNFSYAFNTDVLQFNYSTFMEEMPIPKGKEAAVKSSRYTAYYGSQMHFMRSVYSNTLTNNGFVLYSYKSIRNKEKERVSKLIQSKIGERYSIKNNPNYDLAKLFSPRDTVGYYNMIMKQNDILALDTSRISLRKLATLNRQLSTMKFNFKDTLMIAYQNYKDIGNKLLTDKNKAVYQATADKSKFKPRYTFMYFVEEGGINIEENGYYPELRLFIYGDMSERRISQLLPWDYDPEKN